MQNKCKKNMSNLYFLASYTFTLWSKNVPTLRKKCPKAVTGMVPFQKVHLCTLFVPKGCILVPKWCNLVIYSTVTAFVPSSLSVICDQNVAENLLRLYR